MTSSRFASKSFPREIVLETTARGKTRIEKHRKALRRSSKTVSNGLQWRESVRIGKIYCHTTAYPVPSTHSLRMYNALDPGYWRAKSGLHAKACTWSYQRRSLASHCVCVCVGFSFWAITSCCRRWWNGSISFVAFLSVSWSAIRPQGLMMSRVIPCLREWWKWEHFSRKQLGKGVRLLQERVLDFQMASCRAFQFNSDLLVNILYAFPHYTLK